MNTQSAVGAPVPSIPGLDLRPLDLSRDLDALAALLCEANLHDGVDWLPSVVGLRNDYEHATGQDPARDVLLAWADGHLVGMAETDWRLRADRIHHRISPVVLPAFRHRGLGRTLLAWAERRVLDGIGDGTMGPADLPHLFTGWADLEVPDAAPFAAAAGYAVDGFGIEMLRSLDEPIPDLPMPDGLEVRPVRADHLRTIWDADCEAFLDHRDPLVRSEEDYLAFLAQPDFHPSLWEVAWDGEEVAGSVLNFVFPEENLKLGVSRGWLDHVSVRRPWRRRGLASALMVRSMRRFRDMGLAEAALGADAENLTGAVRVYEGLGFHRVRTSARYRKAIDRSAVDAAV